MTLTLTEIAEVEATEEYIFDQKMLKLDTLIDRLNEKLDRIHAHDKTERLPRLMPASRQLCSNCRRIERRW